MSSFPLLKVVGPHLGWGSLKFSTTKGSSMELRDTSSVAGRLIRKFLGGNHPKKYAIEVDGGHADSFDIPGTELCESWENADGSVMFVMQSREDLRTSAAKMAGVRRVSLM